MLSLKNNLPCLAVKEEETRNFVTLLAQKTLERFEKLESRVDQLEVSTNLQGWLLTLEEREYDERIPTEYMRLFQVINDFYGLKNDAWNYSDLMFMRKAIRTVGLNPKRKISLNTFIDSLTDEIQSDCVGFDKYSAAITKYQPEGINEYSHYVVEEISSPVFVSIHGLKTQYMEKIDVVEELMDEMNISPAEALKRLLRRSIANMNVNLDYEFPLAETAIEILGCLRLASRLANPVPAVQSADQVSEQAENIETENQNDLPAKPMKKLDVKEIKISKWTSISDPLDKYIEENENEDASNAEKALRQYLRQSSRMLYDILVTYFNNKWFYISQGKLFTSQDLSTWEHSTKIKITNGGDLYNTNNKLIINAHVGQGFISTDGESWQKLNLPQKINDEYIHYDHVIYNNGEWKFIGSYSIKHIEKGFLSDKTHSYASAIIMSTQDFTHFSEFNFVDMFKGYHIKYICGSDNLLCAGIRHKDDSNNQKIIYSKDGISWNIGYICNSSLDFLGIFNNTFIAKIDNICYISTDCIQWEKNELLLNYIGDSCRINYFDKFGFGFIYYNDYCGGQFTIITDEFKLKPLTSPGESPIELFCSTYEKVEFDGKNLVAVFDDHCKVCTLEF